MIGNFGGNKYNDLRDLNAPPRSCTGAEPSPPGWYELFFQYMDYVTDANMVMFSKDESTAMYSWLVEVGDNVLEIDFLTVVPSISHVPLPTVSPVVPPSEDPGFSTEALIGIIVGAIFIVVIVAVITGVFYSSSHSASVSAYTRSE
jgi:hypothetical protein